jgi:hypothetical protein
VSSVVSHLLESDEPSIRWKVRVGVLGEDPDSRPIRLLRNEIRRSPTVRRLLDGHARLQPRPYAKWQGGHWVLLALADLGYPAGADELIPIRDRVLAEWLAEPYLRDVVAPTKAVAQRVRHQGVPVIDGRHRRCASQQGGALLAIRTLGIDDGRTDTLVERLRHWQWPDGGWNCDLEPAAASSSVYETVLPMRALAVAGETRAAARAANVLLDRRLLYRRSDGQLIKTEWTKLHYPLYWHYDVLGGLKALAQAGHIRDERCQNALDLLRSKELPSGGWPAQSRYYRGVGENQLHFEHVDWGGVSSRRMNEWVTADALTVLTAAGITAR